MAGNALTDISQIDGWVQRKVATIKEFPGLLKKDRLVPITEEKTNPKTGKKEDVIARIILNNPFVSPRPIPRAVNTFYLNNQQADITDGQWTRIDTVGDGTCSIHALLLSTSESYRRLPSETYRRIIGQAFRREVISPMFAGFPEYNNPRVARDVNAKIFSKQFLDAPTTFLEDIHIAHYSRILKFNVCAIRAQEPVVTTVKFNQSPGSPWIFVYNIFPGHYEAIFLGRENRFQLTDREFFTTYHRYNIQSKIEALIYPIIQELATKVDEATLNRIRTQLLEETDITDLTNMDRRIHALVEEQEIDEGFLRQYEYLRGAVLVGDERNTTKDEELYELFLQKGRDTAEAELRIEQEGLRARELGLNVRNYKELFQRAQAAIPPLSLNEQINANAEEAGLSRNEYLQQVRQRRASPGAGAAAPPPKSAPPATAPAEPEDQNAAEAAAFGMNVNSYKKAKEQALEEERKRDAAAARNREARAAANAKANAERKKQEAQEAAAAAARNRAARAAANARASAAPPTSPLKSKLAEFTRKKHAVVNRLRSYGATSNIKGYIGRELTSALSPSRRNSLLRNVARQVAMETNALKRVFNTTAGGKRNTKRKSKNQKNRKTRKA